MVKLKKILKKLSHKYPYSGIFICFDGSGHYLNLDNKELCKFSSTDDMYVKLNKLLND